MPNSPGREQAEPVLAPRSALGPPGSSFLYIPSTFTQLRTSFEAEKPKAPARPKSTPRKARKEPDADLYAPQNYLMRGSSRAYEQKIQTMNRAAIQDLRMANDMLAAELLRLRSGFEEERRALSEQNTRLEMDLFTHQEKMKHLTEKLEQESRACETLQVQQTSRLRELAKRLKDEHAQRTAAQAELAQCKTLINTLEPQAAEVVGLRADTAHLQASLSAANASVADLRARLELTETKLELETATKGELLARAHAAEGSATGMSERASQLAVTLGEVEAQLRNSRAGLQLLEDELKHNKDALEQEREAHAALRKRAGSLESDLTQLQAQSTLAAAQSVADRAELERIRGEWRQLQQQHATLQEQHTGQQEELLHTRSELTGYKASSEQLSKDCETLKSQLCQLTEESAATKADLQAWLEREAQQAQLVQQAQQEQHEQQLQELQLVHARVVEELSSTIQDDRDRARQELSCVQEKLEAQLLEATTQRDRFQYEAENHAAIFDENKSLAAKAERAENSLHQKEALLAEALSQHASQLELWRAEATEVAQAAAKWKQRAVIAQQQLVAREEQASSSSEEARCHTARCAALEAEVTKIKEAHASCEAQLSNSLAELANAKAQLKEALLSQASAARQADSAGHDAAQRSAAVERLTAKLAEETAKTTALRQDLAAVTQQQVRELDAKSRMLSELTSALQREERAREMAQRDATSLRTHLQALEKELRTAQAALSSISDDKLRAQAAYEHAEAALSAAQRKAKHYKQENQALLEQCSSWLQGIQHLHQPTPCEHAATVMHSTPASSKGHGSPDSGHHTRHGPSNTDYATAGLPLSSSGAHHRYAPMTSPASLHDSAHAASPASFKELAEAAEAVEREESFLQRPSSAGSSICSRERGCITPHPTIAGVAQLHQTDPVNAFSATSTAGKRAVQWPPLIPRPSSSKACSATAAGPTQAGRVLGSTQSTTMTTGAGIASRSDRGSRKAMAASHLGDSCIEQPCSDKADPCTQYSRSIAGWIAGTCEHVHDSDEEPDMVVQPQGQWGHGDRVQQTEGRASAAARASFSFNSMPQRTV